MLKSDLKEIGLTDEQSEKVMAFVNNAYIDKSKFDEIDEKNKILEKTVKERDKQLDRLKNVSGDNEDLKKQIEVLQAENETNRKQFDADMKALKVDNAVKSALTAAKAKNSAVVMPLLNEFLKTAEIDENGTIKGLDKEINKLVKDENSSFLFENSENSKKFEGFTPAESGGNKANDLSIGANFAQRYNAQFKNAAGLS